jgi:hypothetical protein
MGSEHKVVVWEGVYRKNYTRGSAGEPCVLSGISSTFLINITVAEYDVAPHIHLAHSGLMIAQAGAQTSTSKEKCPHKSAVELPTQSIHSSDSTGTSISHSVPEV